MTPRIDEAQLAEIERLARAFIAARDAHKASPFPIPIWRRFQDAGRALIDKADHFPALVELAREGLAARRILKNQSELHDAYE